MSSFLDPTAQVPQSIPIYECTERAQCRYKSPLDSLLSKGPVCHIHPSMFATLKRPIRKFVLRDSYSRKLQRFIILSPLPSTQGVRVLPLVPTQTSIIWVRILQHGILSPSRLVHTENRIVAETGPHVNSIEYSRKDRYWLSETKKKTAFEQFLLQDGTNFISFETVTEWFDMTSLKKIQPVFVVCLVIIKAAIGLEVSGAKVVLLIRAFLEALSCFWLISVIFVEQVCAKLHGEVHRCLVFVRVKCLRKKRVAEQCRT